MRKIAYLGEFERVDMRAVVGMAGDESDEARKYIFYGRVDPARARRRTADEQREANRQHTEGVEVTNERALNILTSRDTPAGFYDLTDAEAQPSTAADAQAVAPGTIGIPVVAQPVADHVYDQPVPFEAAPPAKGATKEAKDK